LRDVYARLLQDRGKLLGTPWPACRASKPSRPPAANPISSLRWAGHQVKASRGATFGSATHLLNALPPFLTAVNHAACSAPADSRAGGPLTPGALVAFQTSWRVFSNR